MDSSIEKRRNSAVWVLLGLACLAVVAGAFFLPEYYEPLYGELFRAWTLCFLGCGAFFFCLGMFFRGDILKTAMFSLLALFVALAVGEGYLTHRERQAERQAAAMQEQGQSRSADAKQADEDFMREFADELKAGESESLEAAGEFTYTTEAGALAEQYVFDLDKIAELREKAGIRDPDSFISYKDEFTNDPILGYRPVRHAGRIASIKVQGGHIVYNVTYTLLPSGWRTTPQRPNAKEAVVFFGCSCTFGEGLNDEESFPYKVGEIMGEDYQTFNFGFHGYGAHHMLAMIENGFLDEIAEKYDKITAFFTTIKAHELRCAGKSSWDQDGPCYEMSGDEVVYKGSFRENEAKRGGFTLPKVARLGEQQSMLNLHIAIMLQADRILREKYNSSLNVVAWLGVEYVDLLREKGLRTLDITSLAGDAYRIPGDGHPNDRATSEAALKIVDFFLENQEE